jgi:hypothetical protein
MAAMMRIWPDLESVIEFTRNGHPSGTVAARSQESTLHSGRSMANLDISDGVCLLGYLFLGRPSRLPCGDGRLDRPSNVALLDANDDAAIELSDAVGVFGFLFGGNAPPPLCVDRSCIQCVPVSGCPEACISR